MDNCYAEIDPKEKEEYTEVYCDMHAMGGTGLTLLRKLKLHFRLTIKYLEDNPTEGKKPTTFS